MTSCSLTERVIEKSATRLMFCCLIFPVALFLLPVDAFGQLEMDVAVGFNGKFLSDHFTPVSVHLQYRGTPFEGEIVLSQRSKQFLEDPTAISHRMPLNLGSNVDQEIHFYFPVSSFAGPSGGDPKLTFKILANGQPVALKEIEVSDEIDSDPLVLVVSEIGSRSTLLSNERVEYVSIDQLPQDWRGLDGVRRVYFGRARINQLSPRQEVAIEKWIMAGGELVVMSGENFFLQDSAWLRSLIPFEVNEVVPASSHNLPAMAIGEPTGQLRLSENSYPILIERSLLLGSVLFATIDLMPRGELQDRAWALLAPAANNNERRINEIGEQVLNRLQLPYPDKLIIGGGLLLYLFVFGFFSLWILKQPTSSLRASMLDMPEQKKQGGRILAVLVGAILFFTIPAMAYLSQPAFTSDFRSVEVGIILGSSAVDSAWSRNWYSTVTKVDTEIALTVHPDAIVAPLGNSEIEIAFRPQGAVIQLLPSELTGWTTKHLFSEQVIPAQIELREVSSGESVRGSQIEVYNGSHWNLNGAALYRDGDFYPIGELVAGESKSLTASELRASDWPRLPQFEYLYSVEERAKRLLTGQPEVQSRLDADGERWILLGWIGNDYLGKSLREGRTSVKLVMIEEEN